MQFNFTSYSLRALESNFKPIHYLAVLYHECIYPLVFTHQVVWPITPMKRSNLGEGGVFVALQTLQVLHQALGSSMIDPMLCMPSVPPSLQLPMHSCLRVLQYTSRVLVLLNNSIPACPLSPLACGYRKRSWSWICYWLKSCFAKQKEQLN